MSSILNVREKSINDDNIIKKDYHTYGPYIHSFKNNDEIRISIQNQDLYVLPSESYIYIEGKIIVRGRNNQDITLRNNCFAYMFDEVRYELNGIEVDRTRYLGTTTTIKTFASINRDENQILKIAGWSYSSNDSYSFEVQTLPITENENRESTKLFSFYVPLKHLLGFAEDYNKIILNSKHELILIRSSTDENIILPLSSTNNIKVLITNLSWRIPHIILSDNAKLKMMKIIRDATPLPITFRSWDCHFNPTFGGGKKHQWSVKFTSHQERPRFIIIVFEHDKKFKHCNLSNLKVHLNSVTYPYDDLNLKFDDERFIILYDMYCKFQESYYMKEPQPLLSINEFKENPLIIVDVSHQNESIVNGPIDIRIEFDTDKVIPNDTLTYCLCIHDKIMEYVPLSGIVKKM